MAQATSFSMPSLETITTVSAVILSSLLGLFYWTTTPSTAPNLPGPCGWPIVGNYFQRGADPAVTYHRWSKIYGPVFRLRLGYKWVVVFNTADAAEELLASSAHAATFQSRPVPYSMGKLFKEASKKTITIGSSPYVVLLYGKRRLSIASVSPASTKSYERLIDRSTQNFVRDLNVPSKIYGVIVPWPIFFSNAACLAIAIFFGTPITVASELFKDIPFPMWRLAQLRNITGRACAYFPFLRLFPVHSAYKEAVVVAKYRNGKLAGLLETCRKQIAVRTTVPCAVVSMLYDHKTEFTEEALTSVSNSMVSSGLVSHMPNTLLWSLGILASYKTIQEKCYQAVLRRQTLVESVDPVQDREDYLMAFVYEAGRYFTTLRLSLARETIGKDCFWKGFYIPAGTTVWCNIHAMYRDVPRFERPEKFVPERYMVGPESVRSIPHFGFGLGRRMCPATILVHKEIYSVFQTILTYYSLDLFDGESDFHAVRGCAVGRSFNQGPKQFRIKLHVRDQAKLDEFLATEI
nr:putative cytochrome P450 monooxygenase 1 [Hypsizygus marmoreus]